MKIADIDILFYLAALVPVLLVFLVWVRRRQLKTMERFAERNLLPEIAPLYGRDLNPLRIFLNLLGVALIIVALARPQWGFSWEEEKYQGLDIIFAVDTSRSMLATDISPDRLSFTKTELSGFVKKLKGDRVGLIAFAGKAFLQCPLTADYDGFLIALSDLSTETIPKGGTSFPSAIHEAIRSYKSSQPTTKALVLITDGENTSDDVQKAIEKAKENDIEISSIGIGTPEGEMIPIHDESGKVAYLKDKSGQVVRSKLMEKTLQMIALETGGMYVHASQADFGIDKIYTDKLSLLERKASEEEKKFKVFKERFQIPLGIAFLMLVAEMCIRGRREKKKV